MPERGAGEARWLGVAVVLRAYKTVTRTSKLPLRAIWTLGIHCLYMVSLLVQHLVSINEGTDKPACNERTRLLVAGLTGTHPPGDSTDACRFPFPFPFPVPYCLVAPFLGVEDPSQAIAECQSRRRIRACLCDRCL